MIIRDELRDDVASISALVTQAFRSVADRPGHPRPADAGIVEARIVDRLRSAGALTLSLVAVADDSELMGHVAFSPVRIVGAPGAWFGMGPVAVRPQRQRHGVGQALVREGLERMRADEAAGIVVLGDPAYYGRFGFRAQDGLFYPGAGAGHFMALRFAGAMPSGTVAYHPAFG